MSDDTPNPGEFDLDGPGPAAPAADPPPPAPASDPEPAADAAADPTADPAPASAPAPAPAADPDKKRGGMLEELITERTLRKKAEGQLRDLNPLLSRLNPDLAEAIQDGRIIVRPRETQADARKSQLADTARELRLYAHDAEGNVLRDAQGQPVPDLEAAERVDKVIRQRADEASAPAREAVQQLQTMTLSQVADKNIAAAVQTATDNGIDPDIIKAEFEAFKASPNGVGMLTQPEVCMQIWEKAVGRAALSGKWTPKGQPAKPTPPTPVPADPTGRRSPAVAVNLTPAMQAAYRNSGIDPTKTGALPTPDKTGAFSLE